MARRAGEEVLNQVRKQGPDAAQRHLSGSRYAKDPRAQKAARTADDLARRFAGTDGAPSDSRSPESDASTNRSANQWGERR